MEENYPNFFYEWDKALLKNQNFPFLNSDELYEIIEIYLHEEKIQKVQKTVYYLLAYHSDNNDLVCNTTSLLYDFEEWNCLLDFINQYSFFNKTWILLDGYKIKSLFKLRMEEEGFIFFEKIKYHHQKELTNLSILYQIMSETLIEADLPISAIAVIKEGFCFFDPTIDFYWLLLQSFLLSSQKKKALKTITKIIKINTPNGKTWHMLGKFYMELNEMTKAIESFELAESLGYFSKKNYLYLISAYQTNGQEVNALQKTKEYLNLFPKHYIINILATLICFVLEKWEEGLLYVNEALKAVPTMYYTLYLYKSRFFLYLGKEKKAISVLKEGIKQTKDVSGTLKKELENLQNQYPDY